MLTVSLSKRKRAFFLTAVVITVIVLWLIYFPEHWLRRVDFVTVKVDDHLVEADVYLGQPTHSEAEAIALVHVPNIGSYFFNFGAEKYREASNREFIPLQIGAWTIKSMRVGRFAPPLPSREMNELQIASSNGHIVTVQF